MVPLKVNKGKNRIGTLIKCVTESIKLTNKSSQDLNRYSVNWMHIKVHLICNKSDI